MDGRLAGVLRGPGRTAWRLASGVRRDQRGQSLPIVLSLVTLFFLLGSALAVQASVSLRATAANESQAGEFHAADGGVELGIWWHRNGNAGDPPAVSLNSAPVTTTVSVTPGTCTGANPSATWLTGFEHGAISTAGGGLFNSINGPGAAADGVTARSGSYSLAIADPGGSATSVSKSHGAGVFVGRFAVRLAALPALDVLELATLDAANGADVRFGYQVATQRFVLTLGANPPVVGTVAVQAGAWHVIDLRFTVNASPRTVAWQVDGVAQAGSSTGGPSTTVNAFVLGSTVPGDVYTANYDDVIVSATAGDYPLAEFAVMGLRPSGMGTSSGAGNLQDDDGTAIDGTSYARLDDSPMTSTADYVTQTTTSAASYVEIALDDTTAICFSGLSAVVAYRSSAQNPGNNAATRVFDGGTGSIVHSGDMSESALSYRSAIVSPASAPWTTAAVNGLVARLGYGSDTAPQPRWDALVVEAATRPGTVGTVTVTATAGGSTVTTTYPDSGAAAPTLTTWTTTQ